MQLLMPAILMHPPATYSQEMHDGQPEQLLQGAPHDCASTSTDTGQLQDRSDPVSVSHCQKKNNTVLVSLFCEI